MRLMPIALLAALTLLPQAASAFPNLVDDLPNGDSNSCANCHIDPNGGGARNDFGQAVEDAGGQVVWSELFNLDSDGDGQTNGQELDDPCGEFDGSNASGGLVSNPGDSADTLAEAPDNTCEGVEPAPGDDDTGGCNSANPSTLGTFGALLLVAFAWRRRRS